MPILNILWNNLDKPKRKYLIGVLLILFVLPTFTNIYNFKDTYWWLAPSKHYQTLVPNYWVGDNYIILYYFIGCYLKDYKLNISKLKNIILLLLSLIAFGVFNFYRFHNTVFVAESFTCYYSFEIFIISLFLANLLLNNMKISIKNKTINKLIEKISFLTFVAYLLSVIFEEILYPLIVNKTMYVKDWCHIVFQLYLEL